MTNRRTKSWSFYALFFCFLFMVYGCNEKRDIVRIDINPKTFEVASDSCTLIATANISEFEYDIVGISIDGQAQDLNGEVVQEIDRNTYVSDWFKVQIAEDHTHINIQLKENTSTETRALGVTIAFHAQSINYLAIYQKGKSSVE